MRIMVLSGLLATIVQKACINRSMVLQVVQTALEDSFRIRTETQDAKLAALDNLLHVAKLITVLRVQQVNIRMLTRGLLAKHVLKENTRIKLVKEFAKVVVQECTKSKMLVTLIANIANQDKFKPQHRKLAVQTVLVDSTAAIKVGRVAMDVQEANTLLVEQALALFVPQENTKVIPWQLHV